MIRIHLASICKAQGLHRLTLALLDSIGDETTKPKLERPCGVHFRVAIRGGGSRIRA